MVSADRAQRARARLTALRAYAARHGWDPGRQREAERMKSILNTPAKGHVVPFQTADRAGATRVVTQTIPGKTYPRAPPSLRARDQLNQAEHQSDWAAREADARQNAAEMGANADLQRKQIAAQLTQNQRGVNENAISRGIFRSSIRDTGLVDVARGAEQQKLAVDTALQQAQSRLQNLHQLIYGSGGEQQRFNAGLRSSMIENAREANANVPANEPARTVQRNVTGPSVPGQAVRTHSRRRKGQDGALRRVRRGRLPLNTRVEHGLVR